MESPRLKRRTVWENKVYTLSLCEELIVLLSSRSEFKFMCNRLSLCLRVCILAELELTGCIYIENNVVVASFTHIDNKLLNTVHQSIYRSDYTPIELLLGLNGELKDDDIQIRMLRKHFYNLLEDKKIIKCDKSRIVFNKIKITNYNVYNEVCDNLVTYLVNENGYVDVRHDVLVLCLTYCKGTDKLLTNLTENKAKLVSRRIERIIDRYRNKSKTIIEIILFYLINYLFYTDEFLDAHHLEFKESVGLFKFEEEDEIGDLEKLFGVEKKFSLKFGF